mgnify:CR=1 FL=1
MPDIDRDILGRKLDTIPEQDREPYLQALRGKGYTWKSNAKQVEPEPTSTMDKLLEYPQKILDTDVRMVKAGLNFKKGVTQGMFGPNEEPAGTAQSVGQTVGKDLLPVAGFVGAGLLTGGLGTIPTLASMALGAGAGKAAQQLGQYATGSGPETSLGASKDILWSGLDAVATELGLKAIGKGYGLVKGLAPEVVGTLIEKPAKAVKWAIQNGGKILEGPNAKTIAELKAVKALRGVQNALVESRNRVGKEVSAALESLHAKTGGAKIFDVGAVAGRTRELMAELGSSDPTVRQIMGNDLKKIDDILLTMVDRPSKQVASSILGPGGKPAIKEIAGEALSLRSAKSVNIIKQTLQNLTDYTRSGAGKMESDIGEKIIKSMARDIRLMIQQTAEQTGHTGLAAVNKIAENTYRMYDQAGELIATPKIGKKTLMAKVKALSGQYFEDGAIARELEKVMPQKFPGAARYLESLIDAINSRELSKGPSGGAISQLFKKMNRLAFVKAAKAAPADATIQAIDGILGGGAMATGPASQASKLLGAIDTEDIGK